MSKQKLFTMKGHLLTNAGRVRTGAPRPKPPIEPKDDPHVNDCGCLSCRVTHRTDRAIDEQLGVNAASRRKGLAPTPGVLSKSAPKGKGKSNGNARKGPLTVPPGVLAGDAS